MARLWQSKGKEPHLEKEYWKIQSQNIKLQISLKLYPKIETPPPPTIHVLTNLPLFIVSKTWEIPLNHYLQLSNQRKTNSPNYQHTNRFSFTFFVHWKIKLKFSPQSLDCVGFSPKLNMRICVVDACVC